MTIGSQKKNNIARKGKKEKKMRNRVVQLYRNMALQPSENVFTPNKTSFSNVAYAFMKSVLIF